MLCLRAFPDGAWCCSDACRLGMGPEAKEWVSRAAGRSSGLVAGLSSDSSSSSPLNSSQSRAERGDQGRALTSLDSLHPLPALTRAGAHRTCAERWRLPEYTESAPARQLSCRHAPSPALTARGSPLARRCPRLDRTKGHVQRRAASPHAVPHRPHTCAPWNSAWSRSPPRSCSGCAVVSLALTSC